MTAPQLPPAIFNLSVDNYQLLKTAYDAYLANSRCSHAKTLRRGEVRGGGKKPWRQKGTGRARFGSTRNPIWRHGGVAFGRTGHENFTKQLSRSAKHQAVRQALSLKNAAHAIHQTSYDLDGKTRSAAQLLDKLQLRDRRVLMVVAEKTPQLLRSTQNLPNLQLIRATYLNVFDLLNADAILFDTAALQATTDWLLTPETSHA